MKISRILMAALLVAPVVSGEVKAADLDAAPALSAADVADVGQAQRVIPYNKEQLCDPNVTFSADSNCGKLWGDLGEKCPGVSHIVEKMVEYISGANISARRALRVASNGHIWVYDLMLDCNDGVTVELNSFISRIREYKIEKQRRGAREKDVVNAYVTFRKAIEIMLLKAKRYDDLTPAQHNLVGLLYRLGTETTTGSNIGVKGFDCENPFQRFIDALPKVARFEVSKEWGDITTVEKWLDKGCQTAFDDTLDRFGIDVVDTGLKGRISEFKEGEVQFRGRRQFKGTPDEIVCKITGKAVDKVRNWDISGNLTASNIDAAYRKNPKDLLESLNVSIRDFIDADDVRHVVCKNSWAAYHEAMKKKRNEIVYEILRGLTVADIVPHLLHKIDPVMFWKEKMGLTTEQCDKLYSLIVKDKSLVGDYLDDNYEKLLKKYVGNHVRKNGEVSESNIDLEEDIAFHDFSGEYYAKKQAGEVLEESDTEESNTTDGQPVYEIAPKKAEEQMHESDSRPEQESEKQWQALMSALKTADSRSTEGSNTTDAQPYDANLRPLFQDFGCRLVARAGEPMPERKDVLGPILMKGLWLQRLKYIVTEEFNTTDAQPVYDEVAPQKADKQMRESKNVVVDNHDEV